VRAKLDPGTTPMITGFVMQGEGSRPILVRGVGETLQSFGLTGAAKDTSIQLYRGSTVIADNDDWALDPGAATTRAATSTVGAFALAEGSKDAAMVRRLLAENYTVHTVNKGTAAGVALVEVYDALGTYDGTNRIANVSARAKISAGDGVLISRARARGGPDALELRRHRHPGRSDLGALSGGLQLAGCDQRRLVDGAVDHHQRGSLQAGGCV